MVFRVDTSPRYRSCGINCGIEICLDVTIKIMEVILTHEQADFDALASLLAFHLLDEKSIPVLPNRLNRNVRNFPQPLWGKFPIY